MAHSTGADNVAQLFPFDAPGVSPEDVRIAEALVFAAAEPLEESAIAQRLSEGADVEAVMDELRRLYEGRGVNLVQVARRWMFRTADDLAWALARDRDEKRKLSRAALETLAIVAYHQPVTRADIEQIRGVAVSKGALDVLMEARWVRMRGRRKAPGRPITYGTTTEFLVEFGLNAIADLPGLDELKGAGLFDGKLPAGYDVPQPDDASALRADEDPLEDTPLSSKPGRRSRRKKAEASEARVPVTGIDGVKKARTDAPALTIVVVPRRDNGLTICSSTPPRSSARLRAALAEASPVLPLVAHRAAYDISLDDSSRPSQSSAQTPIAAYRPYRL